MRRFLIIFLAFGLIIAVRPATAQDESQNYRSDALGVAFQYPADWTVREQAPTRTITASSKADLDAVAAGKAPDGLLLSISVSTFRQIGAESLDDLKHILQKITQAPDTEPISIRIGGADGMLIDTQDAKQDV